MVREGIWDFMGNTVEYEGGDTAFDLDSNEEIPVEVLAFLGTFIKEFD